MAFSFNPALTTDLDRVRFHLGDTIAAGAFFQNETIEAILANEPDPRIAASQLAMALAARFTKQSGMTKRISGVSISYADLAKQFRALAKELQSGDDGTGVPTLSMAVGGISASKRDELLDGSDTITPSFALRQHDRDGRAPDDGDLGVEEA